ncbi:TIGR02186 family protein [Alphaproteobacteria bacterium]|nr:TIGR02186 family protein [Alphaproteobacteria bacterium]
MIRARHFILGFILLLGMTSLAAANSGRLVADLSKSNIAITSGFHGTDLLLFGAVDGAVGDDILVVISGPPTDIAQRRKANRAGIWINVETNIWQKVPSLYTILATSPIDKIASPETLTSLAIGTNNIGLKIAAEMPVAGQPKPTTSEFITALQANMASLDLWPDQTGNVTLTEHALFRAEVKLPANILSGTYDVRVLQFRNGVAISEDITNLYISKGGLSAGIYSFAHNYSALYGIFAILFAVTAGWLAAAAFRRN